MKIAIVSDEHFPYQDDYARSVALKIVSDFQPDLLVVGLDGIDFYQISAFDKNPERMKLTLQDEINGWIAGQREWRDAVGDTTARYFIPGNHEDRHRRFLWRHPELFSLDALRLSSLLSLDELGIRYEEDEFLKHEEIVFPGVVVIKHGAFARKWAGMSARAELEYERFAISTLTGHSHRGGSVYVKTRNGIIQGHECFCLCDLEPEYVKNPDWQQGIMLATVSSGTLDVEPVPIHGFRRQKLAIWRDKEYRP